MRDVMMLRRVLEPVVGVAASMTMFAVMVVVNVPVANVNTGDQR